MLKIERNPIIWELDLSAIMDIPVTIETMEGGYRKAKITAIEFHEIKIGRISYPLPERLVLEDDRDWIDVRNVKSVTRNDSNA